MKDVLLICVKNPFSERDLQRMGIAELEGHFDVRILDCTAWLMPEAYATRGRSALQRNNLTFIHSLSEFKKALAGLPGGYAVDYVGPFSLSAVLLFNALKAAGFKLIVVDSGAYPTPELTLGKKSVFAKVLDAVRHGGLRQHLNARLIRVLLKLLPDQTPDFALVAGSSWQSDPRFRSARCQIPAHSFDYENYRRLREAADAEEGDYAVYLDENIAGHEDNAELGFAEPATQNRFYPALRKYFDQFEAAYGIPVRIAAYPSGDAEAQAEQFGGRMLGVGRTAELIRGAKVVFAHASTAISYAVLWRRPLVFLTSDEIAASWYQPWIEAPQNILAAPLVNIDHDPIGSREALFAADSAGYQRYEDGYLRAKDAADRSLWDCFAEVKAR